MESFFGAKTKLERADHSITRLREIEKSVLAAEAGTFRWQDAEDGWREYVFAVSAKPPKEAIWETSDAIQALRQSLDLAVSETAIRSGVERPRSAAFQFSSDEKQWLELSQRTMADVPEKVKAVVRRLKPWSGGSDVLKALNEAANEDKHRLITTVAATAGAFRLGEARMGGSGEVLVGLPWRPVSNELPIARLRGDSHFRAENVSVRIHFGFANVGALQHMSVVGFLSAASGACKRAVNEIASVL